MLTDMGKEKGQLGASYPALFYAQAQFLRAIAIHREKPIQENLIAIADLGRWSIHVGASLCVEAGLSARPWNELYEQSIDYLRNHDALDLVQFPNDSKKLDVIADNVDGILRKLAEMPQRRQRKASAARKEAA